MSKKHFPCPECGDKDLSVLNTEPMPDYVRRRRRCNACGHRFATYESHHRPAVYTVMARMNIATPRKVRAQFTGSLNDGRLCLHCGQVFWAKIYPSLAHQNFTYCSMTCRRTADKACDRSAINLAEALFMRKAGASITVIAKKFEVSTHQITEVFKEVDAAIESSANKQQQENAS